MKASSRLTALTFAAALLAPLHPGMCGSKEVVPVQSPAESFKPGSGWQFIVEPYGWATGLSGTSGVGSLTTHVDVPFKDILQHLDMAAMLRFEARKGRWGILLDGVYADISAGGNPPGPLYSNLNVDIKQAMGEVDVAFRLVEGKVGFVDLLAGARYNYLSLDMSATVDTAGVRQVSQTATDRIAAAVGNAARGIISERTAEFEAALAAKREAVRADIRDSIQQKAENAVDRILASDLEKIRDLIPEGITHDDIRRILHEVAAQSKELAKATAEREAAKLKSKLEVAKQDLINRAEARVARAEKKLAAAIQKQLEDRLPTSLSASENWVDPIVGVRAQLNLTHRLFLAGRADIGGFSVGSDLTWQLMGTIGYDVTESFFVEAGYRYLAVDYTNDAFVYDIAEAGVFMGFGLRF